MRRANLAIQASVVALAFLSTFTSADAAQRRRGLQPPVPGGEMLTGRALDALTGAPVFAVEIRAVGRIADGDRTGTFRFTGLTPGPTAFVFSRWGYETVRMTLNIQPGTNSHEVLMTPRPTVAFVDHTEAVFSLDHDSTRFTYRGALSGFVELNPLEICLADGSAAMARGNEVATFQVTGPLVQNSICCQNADAVPVSVMLKNGEQIDGFVPLCRYYAIDFVGRDRATGDWVYTRLQDIVRIDFP